MKRMRYCAVSISLLLVFLYHQNFNTGVLAQQAENSSA